MVSSLFLSIALMAVSTGAQSIAYTDSATGITFQGYVDPTGFKFGLALPPNPGSDFLGQFITPMPNGTGWGGVSLNGGMVNHTLIVAWPNGKNVLSSFRIANDYVPPVVLNTKATLSPIKSGTFLNATHLSYTFLCSKCITGDSTAFNASEEVAIIGWAMSTKAPLNPASASSNLTFHAAGFGQFGVNIPSSKSAQYSNWAQLATNSSKPPSELDERDRLAGARYRRASALAHRSAIVPAGVEMF